ncbi:hypothetical protein GWI33_023339 [Rhynchophorus ferrugineus]|uniref:Uncharacterized protein n=1 Tax=Rhynchophorus ferrugineus TaxID=354439 RepID=A0A834IP34_RHYFE|nr:hypothetical protein GWI33_023339 [Rhynchophorus ferrugineus]
MAKVPSDAADSSYDHRHLRRPTDVARKLLEDGRGAIAGPKVSANVFGKVSVRLQFVRRRRDSATLATLLRTRPPDRDLPIVHASVNRFAVVRIVFFGTMKLL